MARRARLRLGGVAIHLVQRGVDRQPCFFSDDDRHHYLTELAKLAPEQGCAIHAYVLMTNHVHLLLTPRNADGPSLLMQRLGRRHVRALNERYERTGTLWEGRFRSCITEDDGYVLACYRYIELNPVRAGMVARAADYPWSSHGANAHGHADTAGLITPHEQYLGLGAEGHARRAAYRSLFDHDEDPQQRSAIRDATNGNYVLGSTRFQAKIEEMLCRRVSRGRPGRKAQPGDIDSATSTSPRCRRSFP
jgi:putative transposase